MQQKTKLKTKAANKQNKKKMRQASLVARRTDATLPKHPGPVFGSSHSAVRNFLKNPKIIILGIVRNFLGGLWEFVYKKS